MQDYYYDYNDQTYDDDNFYPDEKGGTTADGGQSLELVFNACVYPSIMQISSYTGIFLIWNIIFRMTTQTVKIPSNSQHLISALCGAAILYFTLGQGAWHSFLFATASYVVLSLCIYAFRVKCCGFILSIFCLTSLLLGEILTSDSKLWHQMRGTQMIIAMKVISIGFDIDAGRIGYSANPLMYYGYILCPGNCVLGPWISITDYLAVYRNQRKFRGVLLLCIITNGLFAFLFLVMSNCLIPVAISDKSWKWFVAYRDALAFRFSHYFICFLSQAIMFTGGFLSEQIGSANVDSGNFNSGNGIVINSANGSNKFFGFLFTKPWIIEMPRSMVQVVIVWNLSMHIWLKTYVFRVMKPYGIFVSIFTTYIISALLHGINFQLAAVLLSLGIYTYVEYRLRHRLANIYSACIMANRCQQPKHHTPLAPFRNGTQSATSMQQHLQSACSHRFKMHHPSVIMTNLLFSLLAMVHLAYLGVMFEASTNVQEQGFSYDHTLEKWASLNFASHWMVFFCYLLYIII